MRSRLGYATAAIFQALADGHRFGLDIMRLTEFPSGTVYPTLTRAEASGLVRGRWEGLAQASANARPRRRYYELTPAGKAALAEALGRFGQLAAATSKSGARS